MNATKIEWTDRTWNPVTGCDRVSPGCDHCYAETIANRFAGSKAFPNGFKVTLHPDRLDQPLRWRKPSRVFVNSMSDLFHPDVPDAFVADVWVSMALARRHTFQVLTKRPQRCGPLFEFERWLGLLDDAMHRRCGEIFAAHIGLSEYPMPWVWLGTSIENDRYTFRADHLRATPAAVRFLSLEPLLGPLPSLDLTDIDWVIVGGESGAGARRMNLEWADEIVERCRDAGVAVFVKQLGSAYRQPGDPKGGNPDYWPEDLRVREWPTEAVA